MHRNRHRFLFGVTLISVAAACGEAEDTDFPEPGESQAEAALTGTKLVVDDDTVQCPNAGFTTITDAVNAASPGDTVVVCAGLYNESVGVDKTLTILGARKGKDGRSRSNSASKESTVVNDVPFRLAANNIILDGFTIRVVLTDGEGRGIGTSQFFSGYQIRNNIIESDGVTGIFISSDGQEQSVVERNKFLDRLGVVAEVDEGGVARDWVVRRNLFDGADVFVDDPEHENLVFTLNKFTDDANFRSRNTQGVVVTSNTFQLGGEVAIQIQDSVGMLFEDNRLRGGTGTGFLATGDNDGTQFTDNRLANYDTAIELMATSGVEVLGNEVEDSNQGILLRNAHFNIVDGNNVEDNDGPGIFADAQSSRNLIRDNEVRGNGPPDCRDDSINGGSAGTANTWLRNEGSTATPTGICADSPADLLEVSPADARGIRVILEEGPFLLTFEAIKVGNDLDDRTVMEFPLPSSPVAQAVLLLDLQNLDPASPDGIIDVFAYEGNGVVEPAEFNAGTLVLSFSAPISGLYPVVLTDVINQSIATGAAFQGLRLSTTTEDRYFTGAGLGLTEPVLLLEITED